MRSIIDVIEDVITDVSTIHSMGINVRLAALNSRLSSFLTKTETIYKSFLSSGKFHYHPVSIIPTW